MAYKRHPPSLPAQVIFGALIGGVMGPLIRFQERRGAAVKFFGRQHDIQDKRTRKKNPFLRYNPGPQDVFVMTYAKSGTNWMMQIAHAAHLPRQGRVRAPARNRAVARHDDHAVLHEEVRDPNRGGDALGAVARTEARDQDALQLGHAAVFGSGPVHRRHPRSEGCLRVQLPVRQRRRLRLGDAVREHMVSTCSCRSSSRSVDAGRPIPAGTGPSGTGRTS